MAKDENSSAPRRREATRAQCNGATGGIYGLAFIGAAVYYIQHATSFGNGVLGFVKALFWPAVLVYKVLEFMRA